MRSSAKAPGVAVDRPDLVGDVGIRRVHVIVFQPAHLPVNRNLCMEPAFPSAFVLPVKPDLVIRIPSAVTYHRAQVKILPLHQEAVILSALRQEALYLFLDLRSEPFIGVDEEHPWGRAQVLCVLILVPLAGCHEPVVIGRVFLVRSPESRPCYPNRQR